MPNSSSTNPEIHKSLAYLTVLHGIIWSYPREMIPLLRDPDTNTLLLKFIMSTFIPITVRETLLCMVSNWCILFKDDTASRLNLESVVDTAREKTNLKPVWQLLPIPALTHEQPGWSYPPLATNPVPLRNPNEYQFNQSLTQNNHQHYAQGSIPQVTIPQSSGLHQQQPQPYDPNGAVDPIFLSQQQALMESMRMNRNASEDNTNISPEFIEHMVSSSNEVTSMCDVLTETLIALDVEEDPTQNAIVTDMVDEVQKRKASLINFIEMLGPENVDVLSRLTATTDRVDRCRWLFDKTQNSHNEWKAIQESLKTSAAEGMRGGVFIGDEIGGSSSSAAYSPIPQPPYVLDKPQGESSRAMANILAATAPASSLSSSSSSIATGFESRSASPVRLAMSTSADFAHQGKQKQHQQDEPANFSIEHLIDHQEAPTSATDTSMQKMSSKAKGKMVDLMDTDDIAGWENYYNNNTSKNGSGSAPRGEHSSGFGADRNYNL
ncbi:hypothetical protein EV178_001660 [Coemansia sp. RSA 1646]|nr:hypothetical protein EV178_001660 [Coemansia sp. RSA 1646]KAJ2091328.1 hypothetical protein IW138_002027 [Coemansia sp. RSA 986]